MQVPAWVIAVMAPVVLVGWITCGFIGLELLPRLARTRALDHHVETAMLMGPLHIPLALAIRMWWWWDKRRSRQLDRGRQ